MTMARRITALVMAMIMCIGMFVSCGEKDLTVADVQKDPYAAVMTGSEKVLEALTTKYSAPLAVMDKLSKGVGTYEIGVSVPETADVNLSAIVDAATGAFSGTVSAGSQGVTMEVSAWGDKQNIALEAPFMLGEGKYGVKLDTLEEDLKTSELLTGLTGMTYDELVASLETEAGVKLDDIKAMFDTAKITEAYEKYLTDLEAIIKGKTPVVADATVKIGETDVPAISVEYTLTKDDMNKIIDAAFAMYESMYGDLLALNMGEDMSIEDMKESLSESMPDFGENIVTKEYLSKKGVLIATDYTSDLVTCSMVFGEDLTKALDMSLNMSVTVEGETVEMAATIKETAEEGKDGFVIDATVKAEGEEHKVTVNATRTTADGKYEVKITADGEEVATAAGTLTVSAEELKFTVDSVTAEGVTSEIGLTVSAKVGGTVEALPEYTNIITASAEELEGLMTAISGMFMPSYDESYGDEYYGDEYYGDEYYGDEYDENYDPYEGMTDEEIAALESMLEELMTMDPEEFEGMEFDDSELYV